jgi:hypothetical protein
MTPMLCEHCYGPIRSSGYMLGKHAATLRDRLAALTVAVLAKGPDGLAVWYHAPCYGALLGL